MKMFSNDVITGTTIHYIPITGIETTKTLRSKIITTLI